MPDHLFCPNAVSHVKFIGLKRIACNYRVTLDANGQESRSEFDSFVGDLLSYRDNNVVCATCGEIVRAPRTPIPFVPQEGSVLQCDFSVGFRAPEMTKLRPVIVVSSRAFNRYTCSVVPLSKTRPTNGRAVFVEVPVNVYPFLPTTSFAKCEMVNTIHVGRLFQLPDPITHRGIDSRQTMLRSDDLRRVREGVCRVLGA